MKEQLLLLLLSFISLFSYGQIDGINIFSSPSGFRNVGYEDNLFTNAEIGVGFLSNSRFSPEISIGYLGASPDTQTRVVTRDGSALEQQVRSQVRGLLLNAGLVTRLTKRESIWLYTLTNVSFAANTTFKARLFEGDNLNNLPLREAITERDDSVFFNVGLGVEGFIDEDEKWSASLALVYTTFDVFNNFKDLKFEDSDTNLVLPSNGGLGLRFLVRYHL